MQDTKIPEAVQDHSRKRKTRLVDEEKSEPEAKRPKTESDLPDRSSTSKKTAPENSTETVTADLVTAASSRHIHAPPLPSSTTSPAPACNISLTVSSGFYVRSFAHDLGLASHSLGIMASLVRSRQGDFSLDASPTPSTSSTSDSAHPASATAAPYGVLSYTELALGEEHWGPIVTAMLERWNSDHPPESDYDRSKPRRIDDRDRYPRNRDGDGREGGRRHDNPKGFSAKRGFGSGPRGRDSGQRRDRVQDHHASERRWERRNTSSGEE
jgi:tRNA pseudouridine55 synthase